MAARPRGTQGTYIAKRKPRVPEARRVPGKFVVLADLDGAAGVRNPHECFPNFSEYHEFGIANMEADALSAAAGLVEGGADEVAVVDGHFLGGNLVSPRF